MVGITLARMVVVKAKQGVFQLKPAMDQAEPNPEDSACGEVLRDV